MAYLQLHRARYGRRSRPLSSVFLALAAVVAAVFFASCGNDTDFMLPAPLAGVRSRVGGHRLLKVARHQALQQSDIKTGGKVQVLYEGVWYDCEVLNVGDGIIKAKYDDGGDEEDDIDLASRVRGIPEPLKVAKGQRMEVEYEGVWYECDILEVSADGKTCTAKYLDGGDEEPDVDIESRVRETRVKLSDIQNGQKFRGNVVGLPDFGAFVDIGAEKDGLVHVSRIAKGERIDNIHDWLQMGQEIDVWVSQIDGDRLGLTMVEGYTGGGGGRQKADVTPFVDVASDVWLDGVVARTAPFGAFVTATAPTGESADGLVHISAIRNGFVDNVDDEVSEGQDVKVRVLAADVDAGKLSLSMRDDDGFGGRGGGPRAAPVDLTPFASIPQDQWLEGTVDRLAPFGAFVSVTAPDTEITATGLVHITAIRDGFVESIEDELEIGQKIQVRVTFADVDGGKLSLTMKSEDAGGDF